MGSEHANPFLSFTGMEVNGGAQLPVHTCSRPRGGLVERHDKQLRNRCLACHRPEHCGMDSRKSRDTNRQAEMDRLKWKWRRE